MKPQIFQKIAISTALWAILLIFSACSLGKIYIVTSTFPSKEQAIGEAQVYKSRNLNVMVFETKEKQYVVAIGGYTTKQQAERDLIRLKSESKIPTSSRISTDEVRNWTEVWPNQRTRPTTPGNVTNPPASPPTNQPKQVREEVKKDAEQGMEDDFKVYPEKP
jgi:hypothetical protein